MNLLINFFAIFFIIVGFSAISSAQDPDEGRNLEELVTARGFTLQSHSVETDDGYILTLHRIVPQGPFNEEAYSQARKPVIVQHGLMGASSDFLINSLNIEAKGNGTCGDTFAFCLVMTGRYDIWLPNSRGNGRSDGHVNLTTLDNKYWQFTFDQMAIYDSPAVIEFVQKSTGHKKIGYVGHSQGAAQMFALLSLKPEYSQIIQPFIAWAPAVMIGRMTSPMKRLMPLVPLIQATGGRFEPTSFLGAMVTKAVCGFPVFGQPPCATSLETFMGKTDRLNRTRLPVYMNFLPGSVSNWDLVHFSQLYETDSFVRYDYGSRRKNRKMYRTTKAPQYPMDAIDPKTKIAIFRGNSDAFVVKEDAIRLVSTLKQNGIDVIDVEVPADPFNHLDFLTGIGAGELLYDRTVEILDQFI